MAFAVGAAVGRFRLFPYPVIADGAKVLAALTDSRNPGAFLRFTRSPPTAADTRLDLGNEGRLRAGVLWLAGPFQFADHCPEHGCLAVEFTASGAVARAVPWRPEALEAAWERAASDEFPYELPPGFSFAKDANPQGMSRYPNGDLLVTFHLPAFPYAGGVARIAGDGAPVWYRRAYGHHHPRLEFPSGGEAPGEPVALVPSLLVDDESLTVRVPRSPVELVCPTGKPYRSTISFLDPEGRLLRRLDLLEALLDSPFAHLLEYSVSEGGVPDPCDLLHLNFVHRLGEDAGGTRGLSPGDLVVSFRHLSAFAVLDGESGRVRRLARGSFFHQHAVQHRGGSEFLMFDNRGGDGVHGPSRVLLFDLADGRETTIFPNERTPPALGGLFTATQGHLALSPDGRTANAAFTRAGTAVEIRLADGEVLAAFRSLHQVSGFPEFPDERTARAALFRIPAIEYLEPPAGERSAGTDPPTTRSGNPANPD